MHALALGVLYGLGEGAALGLRKGKTQLVGQPGGHVRFMADHGHAVQLRPVHHGHRHKATLGKNHVRFDFVDDAGRLAHALDHAEGVGKVFDVKVAAQLAHRYGVEADTFHLADQCFFHAVGRADVVNFPSVSLQAGDQRQVRRDMPGGSAAGENDFLQYPFPLIGDA